VAPIGSRLLALVVVVAAALGAFASSAVAGVTERSVYYSYDVMGHQLSAKFDSATGTDGVINVYDGFGEETSSALTMGTFSKALTSTYDCAGRRNQVTHPDGDAFAYTYDALGRVGAVYQGSASTACPSTSTGTQLESVTYTNAGLPHVRSEGTGAGIASATYGWDDVGHLTSQADVFVNSSNANDVNWGFILNPASEITSEARTIPNGTNDPYAYGGLLNVNRNYGVNGLNQYTTAGSASFNYDGNGNLTGDGTNTYTYDVENRLVSGSYTSGGSAYATSLTYDPLGRLFEVKQTKNGSTQTDTQFVYDGDAQVLEYNSAGAVTNRYVHGSNAAADDPLVWYTGNNLNTLRYLHADHLGSIVAIAGSNGAVIANGTNTYDEYGINGSGNNAIERFGYTGQAYIPELGMYYYKARFYSPTLGRFLQTDPIGYKDQINLYAYVGDDPIDENDPSGVLAEGVGFTDAQWQKFDSAQQKTANSMDRKAEGLDAKASKLDAKGKSGGDPFRTAAKNLRAGAAALRDTSATAAKANLISDKDWSSIHPGKSDAQAITAADRRSVDFHDSKRGVFGAAGPGANWIIGHEGIHVGTGLPDQLGSNGFAAYLWGKPPNVASYEELKGTIRGANNPDNLMGMVYGDEP
jgi:RHS repeat-associated protein